MNDRGICYNAVVTSNVDSLSCQYYDVSAIVTLEAMKENLLVRV